MPSTFQLVCIFLAVLVLALLAGLASSSALQYKRTDALFTPAERAFYAALTRAIDPAHYVIFGKVRVADMITVKREGKSKKDFQAFAKISQKHIDFVICNRVDLTVFCAIELNDATHQRSDRSARDQFLTKVFAQVKLPLVWITAKASYQPEKIWEEALAATRAAAQPWQETAVGHPGK